MWLYCGIANCSSLVVCWQYIQAVLVAGVCPTCLCMDYGGEMVLMAAAYVLCYFEVLLLDALDPSLEGVEVDLKLVEAAFIQGASPQNECIE